MGSTQRPRALLAACAAATVAVMLNSAAWAQVSSERPGSILIFPKVVRSASLDTRIEISNTYSMVNTLRCFYIDAQVGESNQPICTHTDFELRLTKQQPTQWSVGSGRPVNAGDPFGSPNSGLDPGVIPPVSPGFTGTLICVEVGADGLPTGLNKLTGAATIVSSGGDENRYSALAVPATPNVNKDNYLDLGTEYSACPEYNHINLVGSGGEDPILGGGSSQSSLLTLVPCRIDIESGLSTSGNATFNIYNEFEQSLSGSLNYSCVGNIDLTSIAQFRAVSAGGNLTTPFGYVALRTNPPALGIITTTHADGSGNVATASRNLHTSGTGSNTQIRIVE